MRRLCIIIVFAAVLGTCGCVSESDGVSGVAAAPAAESTAGDFKQQIGRISVGTQRSYLIRTLGRADVRRRGVAGEAVADPQPPTSIQPGSRYEDWVYRRGTKEYHVFLGGSEASLGQWQVQSIAVVPYVAPSEVRYSDAGAE